MTKANIPDPVTHFPARLKPFRIVGQVLFLLKRIDLLFLEFKKSITNMFKLDEAEKIKLKFNQNIKNISWKIINDAIGNLVSHL